MLPFLTGQVYKKIPKFSIDDQKMISYELRKIFNRALPDAKIFPKPTLTPIIAFKIKKIAISNLKWEEIGKIYNFYDYNQIHKYFQKTDGINNKTLSQVQTAVENIEKNEGNYRKIDFSKYLSGINYTKEKKYGLVNSYLLKRLELFQEIINFVIANETLNYSVLNTFKIKEGEMHKYYHLIDTLRILRIKDSIIYSPEEIDKFLLSHSNNFEELKKKRY